MYDIEPHVSRPDLPQDGVEIRAVVIQQAPGGVYDLRNFLDPTLEQEIESASEHGETASHINMAPMRVRSLIDKLSKFGSESSMVLLASSGSRFFVRQIAEAALPNLVVISHAEVPAGVRVLSLGVVN